MQAWNTRLAVHTWSVRQRLAQHSIDIERIVDSPVERKYMPAISLGFPRKGREREEKQPFTHYEVYYAQVFIDNAFNYRLKCLSSINTISGASCMTQQN
jgi:hypothetical protein